jgi:hypothetical protein
MAIIIVRSSDSRIKTSLLRRIGESPTMIPRRRANLFCIRRHRSHVTSVHAHHMLRVGALVLVGVAVVKTIVLLCLLLLRGLVTEVHHLTVSESRTLQLGPVLGLKLPLGNSLRKEPWVGGSHSGNIGTFVAACGR